MSTHDCTRCGQTRPLEEFRQHRSGRTKDGWWCDGCYRDWGRERGRTGLLSPDLVAEFQAILQARELRLKYGISYTAIAAVMEHYHGVSKSSDQWANKLKRTGCPPRPRGLGLGSFRREGTAA